jgi:hypothetical protein
VLFGLFFMVFNPYQLDLHTKIYVALVFYAKTSAKTRPPMI